jgi:hypothetical protein
LPRKRIKPPRKLSRPGLRKSVLRAAQAHAGVARFHERLRCQSRTPQKLQSPSQLPVQTLRCPSPPGQELAQDKERSTVEGRRCKSGPRKGRLHFGPGQGGRVFRDSKPRGDHPVVAESALLKQISFNCTVLLNFCEVFMDDPGWQLCWFAIGCGLRGTRTFEANLYRAKVLAARRLAVRLLHDGGQGPGKPGAPTTPDRRSAPLYPLS